MHSNVAPDVWRIKDLFVNLFLIQNSPEKTWVLIDTGLITATEKIKDAAFELFGPQPPQAILLTHGHFDHIGSLKKLLKEWNVPVYAHPMEWPYLTGQSDYPPPDSSVDGGLMAKMAWMYPKKPINIKDHLQALPVDGSVPFLPGWRFIYTPGHAPGHVSFFRRGRFINCR